MDKKLRHSETSLDPADWDDMRQLGHRMVDDMMGYLENVRSRPAWVRIPEQSKKALSTPAPEKGSDPEKVYDEFQKDVLPYTTGNIHPRFWGWVMGTGTPLGMLAEMLAAGMNPNVPGGEQSPAYVEKQVLNWFKGVVGFPDDASALLVAGCSLANLTCLAVAREAKAGLKTESGMPGAAAVPVMYCSDQTHNSVDKSAKIIGLGTDAVRKIATDGNYEVDTRALEAAIKTDLARGLKPFLIVANAGIVNTGAIDDIATLADLAAKYDMWLHVDGAFGAIAAISPRFVSLRTVMARADSIAFDLHKWMYMPYGVACAMTRHPEMHSAAFSTSGASYLSLASGGLASQPLTFSEQGIDLSRSFMALKVWMSIKEHGMARYRDQIEQNVDQAQYLAGLVRANASLELAAPVPLNIVCFRYVSRALDEAETDRINAEIVVQLQERGIAVPSGTILRGRYAIRVAITNHRSRNADFDLLTDAVVEIGDELRAGTGKKR